MEKNFENMKLVHYISITVFIKEGDDEKLIAEKLSVFLPENFVDEKIIMEIDLVQIEEGNDMQILRITLEKERHSKLCLDVLKELLGTEQSELIATQDNRVDEKGRLYIRIDKQDFIEHDKATLVDHGNCIHFSINIAAYPCNKERALEVVKKIF